MSRARDVRVAREGCLFLAGIPNSQHQAAEACGGVRAIVAALRAHAKDAEVAEAGCAALCSIASGPDALVQAIVDAGGVPAIIAALHAHSGVAAVAEAGCAALRNIAGGSEARKQAIVDAGGQNFLSDGPPPAQP